MEAGSAPAGDADESRGEAREGLLQSKSEVPPGVRLDETRGEEIGNFNFHELPHFHMALINARH